MKHYALILIAVFFLVLTPLIFAQEVISDDYKIGPKDLLEISVFGQDELSSQVRVSEDGKITLPLIGEIEVEGLTISECRKKLTELLEEKYLQNPQVTIFMREYQSKRVSVLGAVQAPGRYELLGRQTLMQLISQAGGLTGEAGDEIIIIRENGNGANTSLKIPIEDLFIHGNADLNIPIQPNDVINVPIDEMVNVYVMGQVRSPGALNVRKSKIPTLLQAIAHAGGFGERASKGGVVIKRRGKDGKEERLKVNVKDIEKGKKKDVQLQENDVVIVPESIF